MRVTDPEGLFDDLAVRIVIDNVNRAPSLAVASHAAALGERLTFTLAGADPDAGTTLQYGAAVLPQGATLDPDTGVFDWTPGPGQAGEHVILFTVSDGQTVTSRGALIEVSPAPAPPSVTIVLTPGFPALPGQTVVINALADSLAPIVSRTVTVDGQPIALDAANRGRFTPPTPGRYQVAVTATDEDGLSGSAAATLKVRDATDDLPPIVSFGPGVDGRRLTQGTAISGTVADANLDQWQLEMALLGQDTFVELAAGNTAVAVAPLTQLAPDRFVNGFYRLRLSATDISGRLAVTEAVVELAGDTKPLRHLRTETDLALNLGTVPFDLTRVYDSLNRQTSGSFGFGWRAIHRDVAIQNDLPDSGREHLGLFNPLRDGTRLYVSAPGVPDRRVAFTFTPQPESVTGTTFYRPAWTPDPGVAYTLQSVETRLQRIGGRYFDLRTGSPYNPASGLFEGPEFTLTAPNGDEFEVSTANGVEQVTRAEGGRLIYTDNAVVDPATQQVLQLVRDARNRIAAAVAPDGVQIIYTYDEAGNLTRARYLSTGSATRYAHDAADPHLLTLAVSADGQTSEAVRYAPAPLVVPITADLGPPLAFTAGPTGATLAAGATDRYTLALRESELASVSTGLVLVSVELGRAAGSVFEPAAPSLPGTAPLLSRVTADTGWALFALDRTGLHLLEVKGATDTTGGAYTVDVGIAGDANRDGPVDGLDGQAVMAALGTASGDAGFVPQADVDRDGAVTPQDVQLVGGNLGFVMNRPPVAAPAAITTHEDLEVELLLEAIADDPDGDSLSYRVQNVVNGTAGLCALHRRQASVVQPALTWWRTTASMPRPRSPSM